MAAAPAPTAAADHVAAAAAHLPHKERYGGYASAEAAFAACDGDRDGKLNYKETQNFGELVYAASLPTRPYDFESAALMFAAAAFAGAGVPVADGAGVTWAAVAPLLAPTLAEFVGRPAVAAATAAVVLHRYDRDRSGAISKGEAVAVLRCLLSFGCEHIGADVAAAAVGPVFAELDRDASGTLDVKELTELMVGLGAPA